MRETANYSWFQTGCEVVFLSKFGFDRIVERKLQYESKRYRLVRESDNSFDRNAVAVFVNQVRVGYLRRAIATEIASQMDSGDVFSVKHTRSSKGNHYDEKYDNDYNDGYYRYLEIAIINESAKARLIGMTLDNNSIESFSNIVFDPTLVKGPNLESNNSGCLPILILMIAVTAVFALF